MPQELVAEAFAPVAPFTPGECRRTRWSQSNLRSLRQSRHPFEAVVGQSTIPLLGSMVVNG